MKNRINLALRAMACLGIATVVAWSPPAHAQSIGVQYVYNPSGDSHVDTAAPDALSSSAVAGFVPQANFNPLGRWGDSVALNDNNGSATSVTAAWDCDGSWHSGSASLATPNGLLMDGYEDTSYGSGYPWTSLSGASSVYGAAGNDKPIVFLSGLQAWLTSVGATSYNVITYMNNDNPLTSGPRIGEHWIESVTGAWNNMTAGADLTPHLFNEDTTAFGGTFTQVPSTATSLANAAPGNYDLFTGLTADEILINSADPANYAGGDINGFQIVAVVPEPASIGVVGVAMALLGLRRNRRN
jgi:hypothetical protein